ncbi:MAG: SLC13 family permease [Bacillota bacterium]
MIAFVLPSMIGLVTFNIISILKAAIISVIILILTKSISPSEARKSIDWSVIILMASAIGIGTAVGQSGLTNITLTVIQHEKVIVLFGIAILIYLLTTILTELVHNLAAAAMMFPIGNLISLQLGWIQDKKARTGEIKNFTGITQTYEEPKKPELIIDTT